ncbi:MAG TPA: oxidoreductase [Gammaproteobacteria bacterium]|nr:oxidoreductase [Gammaproteobacteria bacterium]
MTDSFTAYRIHDNDGRITAGFEQLTLDDLDPGEVVIRAHYSSVNYKDALAATGAGKILRKSPLVGGIDVAGEVISSDDPRFGKGDDVLVTGCGIGEAHDGGYSEIVRLKADWLVPIPPGLDYKSAMSLGTAGFTAALAIHKMEANDQSPDKGPIVVTGATGGVGSFAIDMLAGRGYAVVALTGKADEADYLKQLGAKDILLRQDVDYGKRALEKTRWAGAVDNVGGEALTWLTRTVGWWGNIASIGNAASPELNTTVFPFILRGINLLGVNSMATPMPLRRAVWDRLASDLKPRHLDAIAIREIPFKELPGVFQPMIDNKTKGRTVVRIQ